MRRVSWGYISLLTVSFLLSGCATIDNVQPGDPAYRAARPESLSRMDVERQKHPSGSLYSSRNSISLFETVKAKRVGDILTVVLNESTQGIANARTELEKSTTTNIGNPLILGEALNTTSRNPFQLQSSNGTVQMSGTNEFEGEKISNQLNQLTGSISVSVSEVMSNGNLVIRGEKWINITAGKEYIRLKGIIRPQDITPENTISSLKVADAEITYSGSGQGHSPNVMGWITKFFTSAIWLL